MGILAYKINEIPDLSLNKYASLSDNGIEGVLSRHNSFLRQWHGICKECNASFHLLYCFVPTDLPGERLKLYFIIQGDKDTIVNLEPLLLKSPLSDFYKLVACEIPNIYFEAGATLVKKERIAEIYNPLSNKSKSIHFVPKWEMSEDSRLYDLFRIMETVSLSYSPEKPCAYRIDLYPMSDVQDTRDRMNPILKELKGENDIKLRGEDQGDKRDSYVQNICKEYEEWMSDIEGSPYFRVNVYGFAQSKFLAKILLNSVGAEALMEGDFSLASIKADENGVYQLLSRMDKTPENYCFYPDLAVIPTWATSFTLEQVEPFFRFPVLFDGESIELPKETAPKNYKDGIFIGTDQQGYKVHFPLEDLPKHAFFTGMPGSGKTNTMLQMVTELKKKNVPFLVLEPAKKEYRELLSNDLMNDVYLFSPHLQSHFPLRVNPFEFPKGVRLSEHINALLEVFQGSFVLEGPTLKFLSSSIQKAYTDLGWDIEDVNLEQGLGYPCIDDVYNNLECEINESSYDAEIKGNVRAFLQVRLGGLMERDAGELFNTTISTLTPEQWLYSSAIVELEVLGEQAKNFFVLLICHYILETLKVNPQEGTDDNGNLLKVRHAIFIEEAHNIIASSTEQASAESVDPKISATAYIVKMLAEVRALREAIIIADQLPTALTAEVTKNTNLKLVHRLTSQDDRNEIGTAISASPIQLEQMGTFSKGQALIHYEKTMKPYSMQVAEWTKPIIDYNFANDKELYERLIKNRVQFESIRVALLCWEEKYLSPLCEMVGDEVKKYLAIDDSDILSMKLLERRRSRLIEEVNFVERKFEMLYKLWYPKNNEAVSELLLDDFVDIQQQIANIKAVINNMSTIKEDSENV